MTAPAPVVILGGGFARVERGPAPGARAGPGRAGRG